MKSWSILVALILLLWAPRMAPAEGAADAVPAVSVPILAVPPRPAGAWSGTEFGRRTSGLPGIDRQQAAVAEILRGNVPDFLRRFTPVNLGGEVEPGRRVEVVVWVLPDYLAIGGDQDFLRMPLTWPSATRIAGAFGCILPTTKIVDAVYHQSRYQLAPDPMPPGPRMRSSEYFLRHRQLIERQRAGIPAGELIAGHKKDVVLTRRLTLRRDRVAIYGWHRLNGEPIQPLSTIHGARYADYSHGVRLVRAEVEVDGVRRSIYEVLADPVLAPLLSDEGPIPDAWQLMHPGRRQRYSTMPS